MSLAKIKVTDRSGKELKQDKLVRSIKKPNPFQNQRQFLYDYMFWNMLGVSYLYSYSKVAGANNVLYWLNNDKLTLPQSLRNNLDKLVLSNPELKRIESQQATYTYQDGTSIKIPLKQILPLADISNGMGNWYGGISAIDALFKVISNSEQALDAKGANLFFSGKFMVGGDKTAQNDVYKKPFGTNEQKSVEDQLLKNKRLTAVAELVDIKRFVENLDKLKLDDAYAADFYKIGKMYNIPKDVLEAFMQEGATYENQEKATGKHISYTLQPKANDLAEALTNYFGYSEQGKTVEISFNHLPFVQVFENDQAKVTETKSKTVDRLVKSGLSLELACEIAGINLMDYESYQAAQ